MIGCEKEEMPTPFSLASKWILSNQSLENSIVEYSDETKEGVLRVVTENDLCFEYGDIKWKNVTEVDNGYSIENFLKSCSSFNYHSTTIEIVNNDAILNTGQTNGTSNSQNWARY